MWVAAAISGTIGGVLIGAAAVLLMLTLGRIAGVCGILANVLTLKLDRNWSWSAFFLLGLAGGALLVGAVGLKDWSAFVYPAGVVGTAFAGLLVGVGVTFGSGCTSGHGVCGLSRVSARSLVATLTFMASAAMTIFILRHVF